MSLTFAERTTVLNQIPTSFPITGPQGTATFSGVAVRYANQFLVTDPLPAIVLAYPEQSVISIDPLTQFRRVRTVTTDTFTKAAGVDLYTFTIVKADKINKVIGTVAGVKNTTIAAVNYTLLTVSNQIQFLGPIRPDDGTTFTVEYNHQQFRQFKGQELYDFLTVNVYAKDQHAEGGFNFPGIVVVDQIAEAVRQFLLWDFDQLALNLHVTRFSSIRDLDELLEETQRRRRRQFDCQVRHVVEKEISVETIETVTRTITVTVDP